ncbi:MAG TPA: sigma factor [Acidimicrobiia bacterium]
MSEFDRHNHGESETALDAGDRAAFAAAYDRYGDRIYSFCLNMLRNPEEAAEATYDVFVSAAREPDRLADPDGLQPWLFELARRETRAEGRGRAPKTGELDEAEDLNDLRLLVWQAVDGLGERDVELMLLHLVEGLNGEGLASATGVDIAHLDGLVSRMSKRVEKAVAPLLIARLRSDECDELGYLLGDWQGRFDSGVRARVTRHVAGCEVCQAGRATLMEPASALAGIMVGPAPSALRQRVLDVVSEPAGPPPTMAPTRARRVRELSDMTMLGIFAAVTLILGLIGLAVSAQFEPLEPPDPTTPPLAEDGTTTSSPGPTTTTIAIGTTTPDSNTTQAPGPGEIEVSSESIDFGDDATTAEIDFTNTGGQAISFTVEPSVEAIVLSAGGEEIGPGQSVTYDVLLDRETVAEGELDESIAVTWEGGSFEIAVTGVHLDNPILHNPQANPAQVQVGGGSDCAGTSTTISVRVRDRSPLETVVAQWSPDGGSNRETAMAEVGGDIFEAEIGPFTRVHSAQVRMVAIDELGNAGGTTIEVPVVACP